MDNLIDLLEARSGIVCAVGAGGKKTTLYTLAARHPGRVGLTSTTFIAQFPATLQAHVVIADEAQIVEAVAAAAATHRVVAFALPSTKKARHAGLSQERLDAIQTAARFDVLLVKGDGARMRWIKAPAQDEPAIPEDTTTLIPIVSARAIGQPLSAEIAHRPDRVAEVSGARLGQPLTAEHMGRLLGHPEGGLKRAGDATVAPVINMVDDAQLQAAAAEAARAALASSDRFEHVVLTSARRPDPVVQVIRSGGR